MTPVLEGAADAGLVARGGFAVFEGLLDAGGFRALLAEARAQASHAELSHVAVSRGGERRGGNPARLFFSAPAGPAQRAWYESEWMRRFLADVTGMGLVPSGGLGTYTYYARHGHYLALHRDVESCDVAVITCLADSAAAGAGSGGALTLYPGRLEEPISAIRATPDRGALTVRLLPRQTMVIAGGVVPHAITPITPGQSRLVSLLCYRCTTRAPAWPAGAPGPAAPR